MFILTSIAKSIGSNYYMKRPLTFDIMTQQPATAVRSAQFKSNFTGEKSYQRHHVWESLDNYLRGVGERLDDGYVIYYNT
jgi:hypothetical protein